jgi:hypothetical protein
MQETLEANIKTLRETLKGGRSDCQRTREWREAKQKLEAEITGLEATSRAIQKAFNQKTPATE